MHSGHSHRALCIAPVWSEMRASDGKRHAISIVSENFYSLINLFRKLKMKAINILKGLSFALPLLVAAHMANAGQILLEGSDATTFHHDSVYAQQIINFMRNGSPKSILVMGTGGTLGGSPSGVAYNSTYSLAGFNLANYSGIYFQSPGGCCGAPDASTSISAADKLAIGNAETLYDLSITIENYGGGPGWGAILPAAVDAISASNFGGITSYGTAGGPTCTDKEVVNATGLAKGFLQPPVLGCYEHQGYRTSAFTALGFVSLFDADPAYFGRDGSALLALGGPLGSTGTVPEPDSILLTALGITAIWFARRKGFHADNRLT